MKSNVYGIILALLMSASLSACATGNPAPAASSATAGSSQTTATGSSSAEASSAGNEIAASDIYQKILKNDSRFISTEDHSEFLLNDFLARNSKAEGTYQVTQFAILDMDQDQIPEVVLELSLNGSPEQYEILHDSDGKVYGYNLVYRGFEMLKADGSYEYANGAADVGVQRITGFKADSAETETLGYSQSDFSSGDAKVSYSVGSASVTKEKFDAFLDRQDAKSDAQWYQFTPENIASKVRMDLTQNTSAQQKDYFGTWKVQKVLAYGVGTYSKDKAEKLIGQKLSLSNDAADVLTDEPSDAPVVIQNPEYQETTEQGDTFQSAYQMSFDQLGITGSSVTEVQVTGSGDASGVFLVKDNSTLILIAGGTYFELAKQ